MDSPNGAVHEWNLCFTTLHTQHSMPWSAQMTAFGVTTGSAAERVAAFILGRAGIHSSI